MAGVKSELCDGCNRTVQQRFAIYGFQIGVGSEIIMLEKNLKIWAFSLIRDETLSRFLSYLQKTVHLSFYFDGNSLIYIGVLFLAQNGDSMSCYWGWYSPGNLYGLSGLV